MDLFFTEHVYYFLSINERENEKNIYLLNFYAVCSLYPSRYSFKLSLSQFQMSAQSIFYEYFLFFSFSVIYVDVISRYLI